MEEVGKDAVKYADLTPEKAERIFKKHLKGGVVQNDLVLAGGREMDFTTAAFALKGIPHMRETPFFGMQKTVVLRNRGSSIPKDR